MLWDIVQGVATFTIVFITVYWGIQALYKLLGVSK